jgi:hypothetical protein
MSCYLRHLQKELSGAGIEVNKENRKRVDQAIHRVVGVDHKDCPEAWKNVKMMMAEDKEGFLTKLKEELARP